MFDHDPLIARIAATLKAPVRLGPALDARVRAEIERLSAPAPAGTLERAWDWLRRPRSVELSPLGALALAAGIAAVVLSPWRPGARPDAAAAARPDTAVVQFVLVAPRAASVALVGDFNDWDPAATPLSRAAAGGLWTVTVPLAPGRYRYAFLVDGTRWVADPAAPRAADDDFGSPGSTVTVGD